VYRTPNPAERYSINGVGLGRGWSDYDEARVGADLAFIPRTPLRLYVAYRRQGEGDYRLPYPPVADYGTTPGILNGVVWKTTRVGLSGASTLGRDFALSGDAGINRSTDRFHSPGLSKTIFEGRAKLAWIPRWLIRFD
jgi:hypothetical protein